ncbi:MAG: BMP family ABC transporter substrate-binding protein [Oscillospiraceae bacterium]|nr:BMP family ABC transporter substrate-binding protein [Oscillospiraceae bacterium]
MKKFFAMALALAMTLSLAACGAKNEPAASAPAASAPAASAPAASAPADGIEIALVTDVGNIDDKSFNQGAWEGVVNYAEANGKAYDYFRPSEDSTVARVETISTAIEKGAKVVVCPGFLFEDAIWEVQSQNPDVQFLLLDGTPHNADYSDFTQTENVACILYQEEQAGFFAGYAAVKEGYRKLGFMGGIDVPAVIRFGYGFVQGANAAAVELGVEKDVSVKYWYSGTFSPDDAIKTKAAGWYTDGTEVIFASGGGIYISICAAANEAGAKVIGVDKDQSFEDASIITSATKALTPSVEIALTNLYANGGKWGADYAGKVVTLGAKDECVGLPTETWSMTNYTVDEYNELYAKVVSGEVAVSNATDAAPEVAIAVDYAA